MTQSQTRATRRLRARRRDRYPDAQSPRQAERLQRRAGGALLSDALHRFDMDDEAQIAILTGSGASSTGADVKQRQLRSREDFLSRWTAGRGTIR